MKLYIKYMVSLRCKLMVRDELVKMHLKNFSVELGVINLASDLTNEERDVFSKKLLKIGLELLDDKKSILIERIKIAIGLYYDNIGAYQTTNISEYLSDQLKYNYTYLASIFSEIKGMTLQNYIIRYKIEKVKEYILYNELNLTEISYKLNYSSVSHLSNQFKAITGLSPSYFKSIKNKKRRNLEDL